MWLRKAQQQRDHVCEWGVQVICCTSYLFFLCASTNSFEGNDTFGVVGLHIWTFRELEVT